MKCSSFTSAQLQRVTWGLNIVGELLCEFSRSGLEGTRGMCAQLDAESEEEREEDQETRAC